MLRLKLALTTVSILSTFIFAYGCASTSTITLAPIVPEAVSVIETETDEVSLGIPSDNIEEISKRVSWPELTRQESAIYNIESGIDDDVWVEGKGYFKRTLEEIYDDLIEPKIVGPLHMTDDFHRTQLTQESGETRYVLHVKMKYILTINFELSYTITPIVSNNERVGYYVQAIKTDGTNHIKKIHNTIVVRKIDPDYISIEVQSLNRATMNKEEETRQYVVGLFERIAALASAKHEKTQDRN